jgi:hypothetical protein
MKYLLITTIAAVLLVGTVFADPIHDAAKTGDLAGVQAELDKGVDANTKDRGAGVPPLLWAALMGHVEVAELLIANGADLDGTDKYGNTPLHYAAHHGRKETTKLLITKGADVNVKRDNGKTPLDNAKHKPEIADLLRKHGGKTKEELALMPRLSDIRTYWEHVQLAELVINGKVGLKYEVLYSSDLKEWHVMDTVTLETSPLVYVDKSATECPHWCLQPMRFYRVKLVE